MKFLHDYVEQFASEGSARRQLAQELDETRQSWDIYHGGNPRGAFAKFVSRYNWLGDQANKTAFEITQNLARNLPGALMQDFLLHLAIALVQPHPNLDVFTEVRVPFGHYPLWEEGQIGIRTPAERSDLCIGYLIEDEEPKISEQSWPRQPFYRLEKGQTVAPLVTVNSKIRVSQGEFFDWLGRETLMTKGNPHCLSVQVALRKEMDMSVVAASQAGGKFFLLGEGGETTVVPNVEELDRLIDTFVEHLEERMEG